MMLDTLSIETLGETPNNGILHRTSNDADGLPKYILEDDITMDMFRQKFEGFDYGKFIGTSGTKILDIDQLVNVQLGAIYLDTYLEHMMMNLIQMNSNHLTMHHHQLINMLYILVEIICLYHQI